MQYSPLSRSAVKQTDPCGRTATPVARYGGGRPRPGGEADGKVLGDHLPVTSHEVDLGDLAGARLRRLDQDKDQHFNLRPATLGPLQYTLDPVIPRQSRASGCSS